MSLAPLFFSRLILTSRMFAGEMPPSLLPQWQWLIIYLVLIVVIAVLLIINAAASSVEQSMLSPGIPEHGAEPHAPAVEHSPASDLHGSEMKTAHPTSPPGQQFAASDDLKVIEGIGPKIASVLQAAGINSFAQLAEADPSYLETILREAGQRLADPTTWPEHARLAAAGDWKAFEELTARLKGGRIV